MIDHDELVLTCEEPDPELLELTEEITERLQASEPVDAADLVNRYPQWAGAIRKLLPTISDLIDYGRTVDRDRWLRQKQRQVNRLIPTITNPERKEVAP